MRAGSQLERLARLEEQMGFARGEIADVKTEVGAIRATQVEIRDAVVGARAVGSAARTGLGVVKALGPTAVAIAASFALHMGLPR